MRGGQLVHDYECSPRPDGTPGTFLLADELTRGGNPPPGESLEGLATPERFSCSWDGTGDARHYRCAYSHRHGRRSLHSHGRHGRWPLHRHTFRIDEMVSVGDEPEDVPEEDYFLPLHPRDYTFIPSPRFDFVWALLLDDGTDLVEKLLAGEPDHHE